MSEAIHPPARPHILHAGRILEELLNILYPPPPNPDIITLQDVLNRYRLTGLGVPAITALQQAQRILRATKDYDQIGLCEFHIGLIYLHWGHCLAAAQQFAEARRQWSFADKTASVCLSYYAQGYGQNLALHYEPAMGCYHKAEQSLPRLKLAPPSDRLGEFVARLTELLYGAQQSLREKMWPPDEPERDTHGESHNGQTAVPPPPQQETADSPPPESAPPPPPPENIVFEAPTPQIAHPHSASHPFVPPPIVQSGAATPASVLIPIKESYVWYRVTEREGNFLPHIRHGGWLLVDTQMRDRYQKDDLIIIGGDTDLTQGSIQVKPYIQVPAYKRIFLSRVQRMEGSFIRDKTGKVAFTSGIKQDSVTMEFVLGIVLGFWLNPQQIGV
ncbi:MAG: hypothetical protein H6658_02300 [Ardenticatenaceae bacterium]|nr:hypothetical protein [Ardenticatenaceae bacterium]